MSPELRERYGRSRTTHTLSKQNTHRLTCEVVEPGKYALVRIGKIRDLAIQVAEGIGSAPVIETERNGAFRIEAFVESSGRYAVVPIND